MSIMKLLQLTTSSGMSRKIKILDGETICVVLVYILYFAISGLDAPQPPSVPQNPPTYKFMDMVRIRGTRLTLSAPGHIDRSAGHLKRAADLVNFHSGRNIMSTEGSQSARFAVPPWKFMCAPDHAKLFMSPWLA